MIEHYGRYKLLTLLGEGGMARVYLAQDPHLGRLVAIKAIQFHLRDREPIYEQFVNEARLAAALKNPHVVEIYDFGVETDSPYIVMEYVDGYHLAEILSYYRNAGLQLPQKFCASIFLQAADALAAAHKAGIVHGDIKPSNLILNREGLIKISDFGLARLAAWGNSSVNKNILGTPHYLSPEIYQDVAPSFASDMWALGVTLYQLLTGQYPFVGPEPEAIKKQVLFLDPAPPETIRNKIHPDLGKLVLQLLTKDPDKRLVHAEQITQELQNYVRDENLLQILEPTRSLVLSSIVALPVRNLEAIKQPLSAPISSYTQGTGTGGVKRKGTHKTWPIIAGILGTLLLLWLISMTWIIPAQNYQVVQRVRVIPESLFLQLGENLQLRASVEPNNARQQVDWESDKPGVVAVSHGLVSGKSLGNARVLVFSVADPGIIDTCYVQVMPALITSLDFTGKFYELEVGEKIQINPTVEPPEASVHIQWRVQGQPLVDVKQGLVTALNPGRTRVIAYAREDSSKLAFCDFLIKGAPKPRLQIVQTTDPSVSLARLRVLSSPPFATLLVQEEKWGTTPMRDFRSINSGKIKISLNHKTYGLKDTLVNLSPGQELKLHLYLGTGQ